MSKSATLLYVLVLILASFEMVSLAYSEVSTAQSTALAFIEKALPLDLSKYTVTLTKFTDMNLTADIVQYTLESEENVIVVNCYVQDNVLTGCNLELKSGTVLTDRAYANLTDAAIGFLEKYQTYTERDSTDMINMLSDVDTTKNSTVTAGNLKLTVLKQEAFEADITGLSWTYTIDDVDYTSLKIGFRNGVFDALNDNRDVYTIGDTAVKVSKEQAITNAMKYIETYSYAMPSVVRISGFNVTEDRTVAELRCAVRNSTLLYPFWNVRLFLNQTYPGSVNAFSIGVWADSGEVFTIGHEGPGGGLPVAIPDSLDVENPADTQSFPNVLVISFISVAIVAVVGAGLLVYFKKRKHSASGNA